MNTNLFYKNIRRVTLFHLIFPVVFFIGLAFLLYKLPVIECFFPISYSTSDNADNLYTNYDYINFEGGVLYYTGYDYMVAGRIRGHYYYSLENEICTLFIISKKTVQSYNEVPLELHDLKFKAKLIANEKMQKNLLKLISEDLHWTYDGINSHCLHTIVSQCHYFAKGTVILALIILISILYTFFHITSCILGLLHPEKCTIFSNTYQNSKLRDEHIKNAIKELSGATAIEDDIYITEHYIIHFSLFNIIILHVNDINHIYYITTLHGLPMRRHLESTIIITDKFKRKHRIMHIMPQNPLDIINMLIERNTDIIVGIPTIEKYEPPKYEDM